MIWYTKILKFSLELNPYFIENFYFILFLRNFKSFFKYFQVQNITNTDIYQIKLNFRIKIKCFQFESKSIILLFRYKNWLH